MRCVLEHTLATLMSKDVDCVFQEPVDLEAYVTPTLLANSLLHVCQRS